MTERNVRRIAKPEDLVDRVKAKDLVLVQSVIAALGAVQYPDYIVKAVAVNPVGSSHYEVEGIFGAQADDDWKITFDDLYAIRSVSPARIQNVCVRRVNKSTAISVLVASEDTVVQQTDLEVVFVHKMKRTWSVFSSSK